MLLLTFRETYALNRLSSFKNLRRKGGNFDHRPGRPKFLLRHWFLHCLQNDYISLRARLEEVYLSLVSLFVETG